MKRKQLESVSQQEDENVFSQEVNSFSENSDSDQQSKGKEKTKRIKKARIKDRKLYKQPTAEELNNLKEAETLFHSSLFRLQTNELLKETRLKEKWKITFEKWLKSFSALLQNIPKSEKFTLKDKSWLKKSNVCIPLSLGDEKLDLTGVFNFMPPGKVVLDSTYSLDMQVGPNTIVDLAMEVPKECWQNGDCLNHRYIHKRARYLAYIATHIKNHELIEEIQFQYINEDTKLPTLIITPSGKAAKHFKIRLLPVPTDGSFKLNRFIPKRNNLRPSWFFNDDELDESTPTPSYNLSILKDVIFFQHHDKFVDELKGLDGIRDGVIMLKIWLHQRNLDVSFDNNVLLLLISYLMMTRKIFKLMSSYQVLRNVMIFLCETSWNENGLMYSEDYSDPNSPTLQDFHQAYEVVFIDFTGYYNVCGHMTEGTYFNLKHEATLALELLNTNSSDSFESLFMTAVPFHIKFDHLLILNDHKEWLDSISKLKLKGDLLNNSGNVTATVLKRIFKTLRQGLGRRAMLIDHKPTIHELTWKIDEKPPILRDSVTMGILLNQEFSSGVLEKGPQANTQEATEFREFWGEKSNLRRFQDGTICEAVLWKTDSFASQRKIMEEIAKYLLKRFFNIKSMKYSSSQLDNLFSMPNMRLPKEFHAYGTGEEASLAVIRSYESLVKQLRKFEQLPLSISSIQGISPIFRYAEVFPPFPVNFKSKLVQNNCAVVNPSNSKCPPFVALNEVIIQLESSGKWPEDFEALQRVKAAFYIKIAELLSNQYYLTTSATAMHVDVVKDGFVFRLLVACRKELNLMKQYKTSDGMVKTRTTEESLAMECKTESLTQLTSALHGIQQQHVLFSSVCRLAKRWISAHLLSNHFPEIIVELLVSYLFIRPSPFTLPSSIVSGFLRFLSLLSNFDWKTNVLILNLNENFSKEEISEIQTWFTTNRTTLPPMCIVTPYERHKSIWSWKLPTGSILHRTVCLAKASLSELSFQLNSSNLVDYKKIFRPPVDIYDVTIYLKKEQISQLCYAVDPVSGARPPAYENYTRSADEIIPIVNYDPVQFYLRDLKAAFDHLALFFYDKFGGTSINVIWKPKEFEQRPFKVSSINGRKPTSSCIDGSKAMVPNVESVLQDFALLGSGLVDCIKTKSEKWAFVN